MSPTIITWFVLGCAVAVASYVVWRDGLRRKVAHVRQQRDDAVGRVAALNGKLADREHNADILRRELGEAREALSRVDAIAADWGQFAIVRGDIVANRLHRAVAPRERVSR